MVPKKRASKRQTLQQKYKIVKRTKEHKKRLKKGAILNVTRKKVKTDNRIPNAWPYKEELLQQIQAAKLKMEENVQRNKEKRHEELMKRRSSSSMAVEDGESNQLSKNVLLAPKGMDDDDVESDEMTEGTLELKSTNLGQNSRRAFLKELRKVVESADVILHVLDARDPLGTKSSAIEEMVLSSVKKKLVYVLNKADLVPRDVLAAWLAFLRTQHPAIPFKCNTQNQKCHLGSAIGKVGKQQESALQTNQAVGAEELLGLLKNYARVGDVKSVISVGVVGFPNVGKSSLINSLNRSRSVGVSAQPGFTKVTQEVILDKNIRLIDSPGIVFADVDSAATSLRNCVNVEELEDIVTPIQAILEKCPQSYLMQLYGIPKFKALDCMAFLALVARVTGKLKKGGIPNTDAAARSVLHDWNHGRIKYYCRPPPLSEASRGSHAVEVDSAVLDSFSPLFDPAADVRVLDMLEAVGSQASAGPFIGMDSLTGGSMESEDAALSSCAVSDIISQSAEIYGAGMGFSDDGSARTAPGKAGGGVLSRKPSSGAAATAGELPLAADARKLQKKSKKKELKGRRRESGQEHMVDDVDCTTSAVGASGEYSFEQDFHY